MKQLDSVGEKILGEVASQIRDRLRHSLVSSNLSVVTGTPQRTDTYGWYCAVARAERAAKAEFGLWLDLLPNVSRPVLAVALSARDEKVVTRVAKAHADYDASRRRLTSADLVTDNGGNKRLSNPLAAELFDRPLVESYRSVHFLTVYLSQSVSRRHRLVRDAYFHLSSLVGAVSASLHRDDYTSYPTTTERKLIRRHEAWERSPTISIQAKIRDEYTCKVCGFNFEREYGAVGRGFAETHHIQPLATFKAKRVERSAKDLVTVCANCHRMLHRLSGTPEDVPRLSRLVAGRKR